uniref:Bromodomain and WD repeat domain containing 3 n=1 Tax=Pipistrellus kuhlii TaxID=59472 RepID=A0A7J7V5W5_PIPKU|nr:bromodomain and WD repeat domain containing 3 [Pipistrellus kuhlii]
MIRIPQCLMQGPALLSRLLFQILLKGFHYIYLMMRWMDHFLRRASVDIAEVEIAMNQGKPNHFGIEFCQLNKITPLTDPLQMVMAESPGQE